MPYNRRPNGPPFCRQTGPDLAQVRARVHAAELLAGENLRQVDPRADAAAVELGWLDLAAPLATVEDGTSAAGHLRLRQP